MLRQRVPSSAPDVGLTSDKAFFSVRFFNGVVPISRHVPIFKCCHSTIVFYIALT